MPGPYSSDHHSGALYPGPPPPPQPYPQPRRRRPVLLGGLVALLVIAAVTAVILHTSHRRAEATGATFSDATATSAIQSYLDALQRRDTEVISRNALCGIYDAVRDRRSDQAVAKLSSDAFRKQFSEAQVTSIDKIVYWSDYQAQVLFSMRVQPTGGSSARSEVQGVAQLISQHNQVLVCSYVLRTAGIY
jgi:alkanesulfonate monooxygenase SsuD/methylene tetrahydromethanopterin reductase-like flavin-dependent oxidoreductase (luciferase family)